MRWQTALAPQSSPASALAEVSHDPAPLIPEVPRTAEAPLVDGAPATAPVSGVPMQATTCPSSSSLLSELIPASPAQWLRFARRPEVQTTLRQFCATCGQWLVSVIQG